MNKTKEIFITGFALFALFFGAGDLILPPFLGVQSGASWWLVALGFAVSAVAIPLFGLFAHARLQGTMLDFANPISPKFSLFYCLAVYIIAVVLPAPRTAAVTHEMAVMPYFEINSLITSVVYFLLVLMFVWNRSIIIDWIGKYATPLIVIILLLVILLSFNVAGAPLETSTLTKPFSDGLLEGYQTFGAIAAVVTGAVVLVTIKNQNKLSYAETKALVIKASLVAAAGLLIVFTGLIFSGALLQSHFEMNATRTEILSGISFLTLGTFGQAFLSVLISLACFTTAVGVVTGTADFVKELFKNSRLAYQITAVICCLIGVVVGQMDVNVILKVAVPVLLLIYPITVAMIFLHVLPIKWFHKKVFRAVIFSTLLFTIPDVGAALNIPFFKTLQAWLPFGIYNLGWILPAGVVFLVSHLIYTKKRPV